MGEVYEATHSRLAGRYAIKVLLREVAERPSAFERFQREAEVTSSLRHPGIVQVLDFNQADDGSPFIVMEYLDGESLAARLRREKSFTPAQTLDIVDQVASALSAAHERGIVHRDLKPENVFLCPVP